MAKDHRKNVLAAALAGLVGLGAIAAAVHTDRVDREERSVGGGGGAYEDRLAADGRLAADDTPARRSMDEDLGLAREGGVDANGRPLRPTEARTLVAERDEVDARLQADGKVGPAIVGPKRVGPKLVGPKRVGPKIVGAKRVGPGYTYRYRGGGGGHVHRADHIHYPPGWTRTPRQGPGRNVPDLD